MMGMDDQKWMERIKIIDAGIMGQRDKHNMPRYWLLRFNW